MYVSSGFFHSILLTKNDIMTIYHSVWFSIISLSLLSESVSNKEGRGWSFRIGSASFASQCCQYYTKNQRAKAYFTLLGELE